MIRSGRIDGGPVGVSSDRLPLYIVCGLLTVLALFPPEARGESALGCAALIFLLVAVAGRPGRPLPVPAGLGPMLLFAVLAWPVILASAAPGRSIPALATWFLALAAGTAASRLSRRVRTFRLPGTVLIASGTWAAFYGIWQRVGGLARIAEKLAGSPEGVAYRQEILDRLADGRAFAGFTTPAALGAFLSLTIMITVCSALSETRRGVRWLLLVAALVQFGGLVSAASATASLALAGALAGALLLARWRTDRKRAAGTVLAAGLVLAALLAGVAALRGAELLEWRHGNNPLRLRMGNMRIAAEITRDHPWFGVGPGGYGESYGMYRREGDNESRHAHNLPLEMTAEFGIPGGSLLAVLFFLVFLGPLVRTVEEGISPRSRRFGAAVGLTAFAIHNLADYTAYMPSLLWIMAVVSGLLAGGKDDRAGTGNAGGATGGVLPATVFLAVAGAALISAGSGLAWNARYAAQDAYASGNRSAALAGASRAVRRAPWDVDARRFQARLFLETGDLPQAAEAAEKAVHLSPWDAAVRHLRGVIRGGSGDAPGALLDLEAASRLRPGRSDLQKEAFDYRRRMELVTAGRGASGE